MGNLKYVVLDTETSGLFDFSKPADAEGQPRMASIAMIYLDDRFDVVNESLHYVKPDGWVMSEEAAKIHGLTNEILNERGDSVDVPLDEFVFAVDSGLIVIAFNAQYDLKILRGELRRSGRDDRFDRTPNICIMRAMTNILKIPSKRGIGYKWPKLSEAAQHFNIEQKDAHTALDDTRVTTQIAKILYQLGELPEPNVYFAKGVK